MAKLQPYEAANEADAARIEAEVMERLGRERADALGKVPITVVDDDEQDDMVVGTLLGTERDLVARRLNIVRYDAILNNGATGEHRMRIVMLLGQELYWIEQDTATAEHTTAQLPDQARVTAAVARIKAREAAARGQGNSP